MTEPSSPPAPIEETREGDQRRRRLRLGLLVLTGAAFIGVAGGAAAAFLTRSPASSGAVQGGAALTWAAGSRSAPNFALHDQNGQAVSLSSLRGRTVIVTFVDPLCRNYCPLEAHVLNAVVAGLAAPQRPAIVAVSVNQWGNARTTLLQDVGRWHLVPEWRWAIGSPSRLAATWHDYQIGVEATSKTIAGVTVHQIAHTEAAYVVDGSGHERALFVWPFTARDVEQTLAALRGT
jgi:cytochrome oxidase Cu insertion factor (SCO1/SenC/PrrC family)